MYVRTFTEAALFVVLHRVLNSTFVVNFVEIAFAGMQPMSSTHEIIAPSTGAGGTLLDARVSKVPACHHAATYLWMGNCSPDHPTSV